MPMSVGYRRRVRRAAAAAYAASVLSLLLWNVRVVNAAPSDPDQDKGFVLVETFQGNTGEIGTITKLDTMTGYQFNRHFEMDAGVPFYFVRPSSDSQLLGATAGNGIGNAYLSLRFSAAASGASFVSSLTGWAPTGDVDRGYSTGRATVDWNNYLGFTAGRITPFVNFGLANSISDTRFFTRPFTSLGKVAHVEGGADLRLAPLLSVGGSAYADAPFGTQRVYSKLVSRGQANPPGHGPSSGRGRKRGVFENQSVTIGDSSIARDNGGSLWLDVNPDGVVNFEAGYSRSFEYALNSLFFSVRLSIGDWLRSRH